MARNTNMHVTREQARDLRKCVRFAKLLAEAYDEQGVEHQLPPVSRLKGLEAMLGAAQARLQERLGELR